MRRRSQLIAILSLCAPSAAGCASSMRPADVVIDDPTETEAFDAAPDVHRDSAADVRPLMRATAVFAGSDTTCAIDAQGAVYCWGNIFGPVAPGVYGPTAVPVPILLPAPAVSVAVGGGHACAIDRDGALFCWGRNDAGQLGSGDLVDAPITDPVRVTALSHVTRVVAGSAHTCAIDATGALFCWGANDSRQLSAAGGNRCSFFGEPIDCMPAPQRIAIGDVIDASAGASHTCAVLRSGSVLCWGSNETLQDGGTCTNDCSTRMCCATPITVASSIASTVSCGGGHSCLAMPDGGVQCWGANDHSQLASTTITQQSMPATIEGANAIQLVAGGGHTCILTNQHEVACWGANSDGQLGEPRSDSDRRVHVVVESAIGLAAGTGHTCALSSDGSVSCWGANLNGQLGDGSYFPNDHPLPVRL